ncbi:MAG: hypothetical protein C0436_04855 [Alphaproteobacteria bacterium]|nr:hypothetical protein [Alphaproteobacteria bacterium]
MCMAIDLTPEEELMIARQRAASARANAAVERVLPSAPSVTWGGVVKGVKSIVKTTFVVVASTAAFVFAAGFLSAVVAANPALAPYLGPVVSFMQSACTMLYGALGTAGSYLSNLPLLGASLTESVGATALTASALGGAAVVASHKATLASHASMPVTPDIDPTTLSTITAKKTAAMNVAQAPAVDTGMLNALPDSPHELRIASEILQQNSQSQSAALSKTAAMKTAAHVAADETHDAIRHRREALARVQKAHADKTTWVERVNQNVPDQSIDR